MIPRAFAGTTRASLVGGDTADNVDFIDAMNDWLPIVFAFVLGFSFVLLTVVFRSIVIAATSIVLNLLSVGAAYGLVILVFRHGMGSGLLGFQRVDAIEAWVPLFLFSVLFGLSMDYQVFLLSRIKERYDATATRPPRRSRTASRPPRGIITGAALIIVAVFAGFAMGDLVMFQQMGFGIAVALLIDATIIRSVLLPAAMQLLGRWNWYLPRWLEWLPRIEVEAPTAAAPARGEPWLTLSEVVRARRRCAAASSSGFRSSQRSIERQPQPMHVVRRSRRACRVSMRASRSSRQRLERRSQSRRLGVRLVGQRRQRRADLAERDAGRSARLDECDPAQHGAVVAALVAVRPGRGDQPAALVEAQRRGRDAASPRPRSPIVSSPAT